MAVENLVWILPRPRRDKFRGGFPLHFEKKLLRLYGSPKIVLHPFGGKAEYGWRIDVNPDVEPDIVADAHQLPIRDNSIDMIILDPPYSEEYSKEIFGTGKVRYWTYIREAVRVCKPGGYIAMYHLYEPGLPKGVRWSRRIFVGTRKWHKPRVCCVWQKE